ncbi:hypothetical protein Tco_0128625 [Tanacetum coccineum]
MKMWKGCLEATANHKGDRGTFFCLVTKGGDRGACKLLRWLLGDVMEVLETSGLDKLRLSRAQILWGMFRRKNVDYVELLWEDFIYQIENRVHKKQEKMYYPRFTKVIIHHFLTQEKSLSWRNKIRMHTSKDDYLINSLRFISAKESTQIYGAILPECLTSPAMKANS